MSNVNHTREEARRTSNKIIPVNRSDYKLIKFYKILIH
jgi:hypothetical protein